MKRLSLLATAVVLGVACATVHLPEPTAADAQRMQRTHAGTTVAALARGRALYLARCTGCHQAVDPKKVAPQTWAAEVAEMRKRARLQPDEEDLVVRYLVAMATQPPPEPAVANRDAKRP